MNSVTISGIVVDDFNVVRADTVHFLVGNKGRDDGETVLFDVIAHGDIAKRLQSKVKSGQRIVLQGRLSSEKLSEDDPTYHNAIVVSRVLSEDGSSGMDYSNIVIEAMVNCNEVKTVGAKAQAVANLDLKAIRRFKDKEGNEKSFTSFLSASVWGERAEALRAALPFTDQPMFITGTLRPRQYENKEGNTVKRIDIWVDELTLTSGSPITSIPQKYENKDKAAAPARGRARAAAPAPTAEPQEDLPF